eukprot:symbB.v1.2.000202.t1/scaffold21.1/size436794/21
MNACSKGLQWNRTITLFDELINQKKEPDGMSFATCITANGNASFWQRSLGLFHQMQRKMKADLVSFTSIIHACGMGFAWQMSMKFLSDLKVYDLRPNVTTYGAAVAACERGSTWPTALAILKQMEWDQCHPNTISIGSALVACQKALQWQRATKLMQHFGLEDRVRPESHIGGRDWKAKNLKAKLMNSSAAMQASMRDIETEKHIVMPRIGRAPCVSFRSCLGAAWRQIPWLMAWQ